MSAVFSLQCLDDAQLVFGRDTGEHGGFLHQFGQCGRVEAVEHAAFVRLAGQAEFAGDGRRRDGVIASDHLDLHAGGPAQADGFLRLGARRVDDADQRHQRELVGPDHEIASGIKVMRRNGSAGQRQHAHRILGKGAVAGDEIRSRGLVERSFAVAGEPVTGPCQQDVGSALHPHAHNLAIMVEGGHELVRRIEGNLGDARRTFGQRLGVEAGLGGQRQQRTLGRIADQFAIMNPAVGAQCRRRQ